MGLEALDELETNPAQFSIDGWSVAFTELMALPF